MVLPEDGLSPSWCKIRFEYPSMKVHLLVSWMKNLIQSKCRNKQCHSDWNWKFRGPAIPNNSWKQHDHEQSSTITPACVGFSFCRCDSSDYDDILRDVEDHSDCKPMLSKCLTTDSSPTVSGGIRCFPVYIGGSANSSGCSTVGAPRLGQLYITIKLALA